MSVSSLILFFFFFSSRRRHTRFDCDWSSDVCSSDLRRSSLSQRRHDPFVRSRRTRYRTCGAVPCKRGAGVQTMRKTKDRKPSATVITACSAFSAVCVLGAACHFDSLLGSGRKGGGSGGGGGWR